MQCMDFVDLLYLNLNMLWFSIEHFAKRFYNQRYQILYIYIYIYIYICFRINSVLHDQSIGVNVKALFIRRSGVGSNSIFARKDIRKIHQMSVVNIHCNNTMSQI